MLRVSCSRGSQPLETPQAAFCSRSARRGLNFCTIRGLASFAHLAGLAGYVIPFVIAFWIILGLAALTLPIVGAINSGQGNYYRYPVVGLPPG